MTMDKLKSIKLRLPAKLKNPIDNIDSKLNRVSINDENISLCKYFIHQFC